MSRYLQIIKLNVVQTERCNEVSDDILYLHDSQICTLAKAGEGGSAVSHIQFVLLNMFLMSALI